MNPFPLILSSPSGGGKTTIAKMLLARRPDVGYSTSCTTRQPRNGEVDGRDYFFLTREEFLERQGRRDFAESAEVFGNLYGTLKSEVNRVFATGKHVVMDIDVQGARQFLEAYPESVLVFLLPPSIDALLGRLTARRSETPEGLLRRLTGAREELRAVELYQYVVVNDDLERAYTQVSSIVDAETVRHRRIPLLEDRVLRLLHEVDAQIQVYAQSQPDPVPQGIN